MKQKKYKFLNLHLRFCVQILFWHLVFVYFVTLMSGIFMHTYHKFSHSKSKQIQTSGYISSILLVISFCFVEDVLQVFWNSKIELMLFVDKYQVQGPMQEFIE